MVTFWTKGRNTTKVVNKRAIWQQCNGEHFEERDRKIHNGMLRLAEAYQVGQVGVGG